MLRNKTDKQKLNDLIYESNMFIDKETKQQNTNECWKAIDYLIKIFKKPHLVNVFQLDSDESSHDIELAILKVFLNCIKLFFFNQN